MLLIYIYIYIHAHDHNFDCHHSSEIWQHVVNYASFASNCVYKYDGYCVNHPYL